jgi:hypothetical protein
MFVAAPVAAGTAGAAQPNKTTILLTCDRNVDAQATVTLRTAAVGGTDLVTVTSTDLNCGPDSISGRSRARVVVTTDVVAGAVTVPQLDMSVGSATASCPDPGGVLPGDFFCAVGTSLAELTVK